MSHTVRIADDIVEHAHAEAARRGRSVAGQIDHGSGSAERSRTTPLHDAVLRPPVLEPSPSVLSPPKKRGCTAHSSGWNSSRDCTRPISARC
ncbi:ParD-like family protein [Tsukamurella tyrosinosolvens]|uniref:ParD-like family protein n=1 Tax=Tsukamurella tyrosinosolvens TaxID=57704 RepID=UPI001EE74C1C|nr:ParD-like family protein [Tsukamurella tyrosinosolvens]